MIKRCIVCKKRFTVFETDVAQNRGKYCSRKCYLTGIRAKMLFITCANCGKKKNINRWRLKSKPMKHRFCSIKCFGEFKRNNPDEFPNKPHAWMHPEITCEWLQKEYGDTKKTIREIAKRFNCSYPLIHTRIRKCNISMRHSTDYSLKSSHAYWQEFLNKKYKNTCRICGWNKTVCDIHHKVPPVKGGKNTEENLKLLCPNCHRLVHKNLLKI